MELNKGNFGDENSMDFEIDEKTVDEDRGEEKSGNWPYLEWRRKKTIDFAFVQIPEKIIEGKGLGKLRVSILALMQLKRNMENELYFPTKRVLKWLGRKPHRGKNGINENIEEIIEAYRQMGYVGHPQMDCDENERMYIFNADKIKSDCKTGRYACLYSDEIRKILDYSGETTSKKCFNLDTTLLVFAYLRMNIYRRKNNMTLLIGKSEEESRKIWMAENPECWYGYYEDIAEDVGLTVSMVSTAVSILTDLGLIYCGDSGRFKVGDRYISGHKLITNTYKRSGSYLLASGEDYYIKEFENRKKQDIKWRKTITDYTNNRKRTNV